MTHLKTFLVTAAASLALASPAFADGHMESKAKVEASAKVDAKIKTMWENMSATEKAEHQAKMLSMSSDEKAAYKMKLLHKTKLNSMTPEERAAYKQKKMKKMSADGKMTMKDKMHTMTDAEKEAHKAKMMNMTDMEKKAHKKSLMSAPSVMQKSSTNTQITTSVSCPAGTTAQPDNTCLITGDFAPKG
ncbi:hypothetical protein DES40_1983 [Litorimonas taeanensis]|uniref:LTXXQ motif family protein n=1 Tax=Litorimonas taeanensis TaxID=568099 RepID=A0A420WDS6_9PROT|nr:hypothetical protein [Litorimonas taeanensis]RKQ69184.1 hypothetical protein DES40_1983 [Litorimonas taeanensis]